MTQAAQRLERADQLEELRFQKALLEAQGEASLDGILVVSSDGRILSYNRRFAELWRLPPEVLAQRSDGAALEAVRDQLADPDQFLAQVGLLYANPDATSRDEILLKDGRVFERYTAPVTGPDGTHYGRVWFFRDATEQRDAAQVRDQLVREHAARDAAVQRTTRLRALHEAALAIAGPVSADRAAVARSCSATPGSCAARRSGHRVRRSTCCSPPRRWWCRTRAHRLASGRTRSWRRWGSGR